VDTRHHEVLISEMIKFYTMSVLEPDNSSTNIDDIVFLYRYVFIVLYIANAIKSVPWPLYGSFHHRVEVMEFLHLLPKSFI